MKKILLLFITLTSIVLRSYSQGMADYYPSDWQRYGSVYIDNLSITKDATSIKAWIIHPDFKKSKPNNRTYMYEAAYFDAKCDIREMALLNTAWYDKYHKLVKNDIEKINYIKISPKTNNEIIFKAICAQKNIM